MSEKISKLDEVLERLWWDNDPLGRFKKEARQQLKALMLELIGEDHEPGKDHLIPYHDTIAQNEIRSELRQKVEEL